MKKILATIVLCVLTAGAMSCDGTRLQQGMTAADSVGVDTVEYRLSMLFCGDLMQHEPQIRAAHQSDGSYDYAECFQYVKPEIERADVAVANFEVTLGGKPYKGYPQFSAPDEYLGAAVDAGFDVLLTANNHCLDSYQRGLERTIAMMDSLKVPHLGTYINKEERAKNYPFLLQKNGLRVVLLAFTYGTNGLKVKEPNIVNYMDTLEIAHDIAKAKTMNPDVIIALPHWGIEYQLLPSAEQKEIARWLLANGVDHVIGGHPHVPEPLELRDGNHLVAYSMGNFISNQSKPNTYGGYMVRMEFSKKGDTTKLADCGYTLYWVTRPADGGRKQYRIYPIDIDDSHLTPTERIKRNSFRTTVRRLFEKNNKGNIKEYQFK